MRSHNIANTIASPTTFNHRKYQPFPVIDIQQRQWPDKTMQQAPQWCSVDLRDGNQALVNPLSVEKKLKFFKKLLGIGFKQIEVGFPSASQDDFDFVRTLIRDKHIPDDVTIAVLTPARKTFIERSFAALCGAKKAIVHLYNPTSKLQREKVFKMKQSEVIEMAVAGANVIQQCASTQPETQWQFQYSPESFTATELDFSVEICNAVLNVWQSTQENPVILNLPSTVEMAMPNIYADQIEWFCRHVNHRENIIISVHTHNDRGCAVAAAEMAVLAGADRVEGTLLGNGERTGNMDIITMAMNCYSQGIDPQLDLSDIQSISDEVSRLIELPIHPRHPYIGELVYSAFSGSHQDAIRKCLIAYMKEDSPDKIWDIAYLPIDPADLGRNYEKIIRINSQSGKGGMAYIIEQALSMSIPRWLQLEFSQTIQQQAELSASEISAETIISLFRKIYLTDNKLLQVKDYNIIQSTAAKKTIAFDIYYADELINIKADGVGILDCFVAALAQYFVVPMNIVEYNEQTLQHESSAQAIAFIRLQMNEQSYFSAIAQHQDIVMASLNAILQAAAKYFKFDQLHKK